LVPAFWNVLDSVAPLPSGHCVPPDPSGPSSSQVYVHGVAGHADGELSNCTLSPAFGELGEYV